MEDYESERSRIMKAFDVMGLMFTFGNGSSEEMIRSSSGGSPQKMILLKSREGETFEVEESVALESLTIKEYLEDDPDDRTMPFGITSNIMVKVIEYLKRPKSDLKKFDAEFVKEVDRATLSELTRASIHLQIKSLFDLTLQVSEGKTRAPAQARNMSSKEIVAGVESVNEVLYQDKLDRDLLNLENIVASTHTHGNRSYEAPQKMIFLESLEGDTFEVEESVAFESLTIKEYLEDDPDDRMIPCPRISSKIMPKVIEYLKRHVEAKSSSSREDLKEFDAEFVKVDSATLAALGRASVDLQCKSFHDLIIQTADKKMSSKEIVAGVESGNGMLSGLLSVASTHTHPQNAESLKLNRDFVSAFRSSKLDRDSLNLENTVTKKRKEELCDDSKDYSIIIGKRQKAATK